MGKYLIILSIFEEDDLQLERHIYIRVYVEYMSVNISIGGEVIMHHDTSGGCNIAVPASRADHELEVFSYPEVGSMFRRFFFFFPLSLG